jgi:hypothetical protein
VLIWPNQAERGAPPQPPIRIRIKAMTDIEVQESYTDHDGGEFSAVNVRVVATWPAPTFVENLAIDSAGRFSSASIPIIA